MTIRMKDIAKELGLSVVTVSKVLRNHPDISEKTRNRVLDHVRERDYQPNVLARSLVTGHSFLVALVVPSLIHPFFAEVAKALSQTIRPLGYSLLISTSEEDAELESREIRQLVARQVDALVIASTSKSGAIFDHLKNARQNFVLIDRDSSKVPCNFVGADDVAIGDLATEHLIKMGCKRIAHIGGCENDIGMCRLKGYRQALRRNGFPANDAYIINRNHLDTDGVQQGAYAVHQLLALKERPDGIFCFNDPIAVGAMDELLNAGIRIPDDIAVIGCGNLHYDKSLRVPLSSVDQHSQLIGEWAGKIILKLIESKTPLAPQRVFLQPSIVARSSSARAKTSRVKKKVKPGMRAEPK